MKAYLVGVVSTVLAFLGGMFHNQVCADTNIYADSSFSGGGIVLAAKDNTDYAYAGLTKTQRAAAISGLLGEFGYNKNSVAAILANFNNESSSLRSDRVSKDYKSNSRLVIDNDFRASENGKNTHKGGFGLASWTHWSRVEKLQKYADSKNTPVIGLKVQVEFYHKELKSHDLGPDRMNKLELEDAIYRIWTKVQRSSNAQRVHSLSQARSNKHFKDRVSDAKEFLKITPSNLLTSNNNGSSGSVDPDSNTNNDGSEATGAEDGGEVEKTPCETSILPDEWCNAEGGGGIYEILNLVIAILTAGIGVGATVGIVISATQYLTARDNEEQAKNARKRLMQVVIGLLTYALMWAFLQWLLPGGVVNTIVRTYGTASNGSANTSSNNTTGNNNNGNNNNSNNSGTSTSPSLPETDPIKPPAGANVIRKATSSTMEVTIQKTSDALITRIWAKDPYNQLNKYAASDYGKDRDSIQNMLNKAISAKGLKNKIAIGTNSDVSTSYGGYRCNTKLWKNYTCMTPIIHNGKIIKQNTKSTVLREMSYGITKNGELKLYFVDYPNDPTQDKPEWAQAMHDQIRADGVRNTFMGKVGLIENGKKIPRNGYSEKNWKGSATRILFCQVDKNNFIYVTKTSTNYASQNYMLKLGCRTAVSMDGGGSTNLFYKNAKSGSWDKIKEGDNRRYMWSVSYWTE